MFSYKVFLAVLNFEKPAIIESGETQCCLNGDNRVHFQTVIVVQRMKKRATVKREVQTLPTFSPLHTAGQSWREVGVDVGLSV